MESKKIQIGNRKVGQGNPTFMIAELSCNHLQDYGLAVRTIEAMATSGADAVKLQAYTPDSMTLDNDRKDFLIGGGTPWDGKRLYELYKKAYTPWEWFPRLQNLTHSLGMEFFSSAFSKPEVDMLEDLNVPIHKISSFEVTDIGLIEYASSKGKPMIISTGLAQMSDLEKVVEACRSKGNEELVLLKCTSAYPTPYEEANLLTIPNMAKRYDMIIGLSDHTHGIIAPITSVALGANLIEKHFILDRELKYPNGEYSFDRDFSLEPLEYAEMVKGVRTAEKVLGRVTYELSDNQVNSKIFMRSLYVSKDVHEGEVWTEENVRTIRPGFGMHPEYLPEILGKISTQEVKKGTRMSRDLYK